MFKKVLIANRGEIAVRVLRTCREMGIKTVAVYSEADRESLHVRLVDESVCIGPPPAAKSYLDQDAIISAAKIKGADAIHPGYGFLAENAAFAARCPREGITFIGPHAEAIRKLGNKLEARALATGAGVDIIPGASQPASSDSLKPARKIGFPLMIKACAGGGGKGMRMVRTEKDFKPALKLAEQEAHAAFGDGSVYFEKLLDRPRHIEIQIAADMHGNAVAFPERDCSIQRRHQKLVEESPSPAVTPEVRAELMESALKVARACRYTNVGTVEFLMDSQKRFYFLEVNTRLQVEHPVTEWVTGIDLLALQIGLAAGERLSLSQKTASRILGHALEHRLNAEDPANDFSPHPGLVSEWAPPGGAGVRLDTHIYPGYTVPSFYDSLIAKLIVFGPDRKAALAKAKRALSEFRVQGILTTIPFHLFLLDHPDFARGEFDTGLLERIKEEVKS